MFTAIIIGFLGSLHCMGMCGPIALAIPIPEGKKVTGFLLYHSGRILLYSLLGLVFGLIGFSAVIGEAQQILTITVGVLFLLIIALPSISGKLLSGYYESSWMSWVKAQTVRQFKQKTYTSTFLAGMLNGFLPCGLIYMAIGGTFLTNTFLEAGLYMALFGLGTLPALLFFWLIPSFKKLKTSLFIKNAVPLFGIILAMLFIYRGVSFSIPEIDPILGAIGFEKIPMCR